MASRGKVKTRETMDEFVLYCTCRDPETIECSHPDKTTDHCLSDKKHCPRVDKRDKKDRPAWKDDYHVYLQEHDTIFKEVIMTDKFIKPLERRFRSAQKIDVRATIMESSETYWRIKSRGWQNKRSKGTQTIDWERTYIDSVVRAVRSGFAIKKNNGNDLRW